MDLFNASIYKIKVYFLYFKNVTNPKEGQSLADQSKIIPATASSHQVQREFNFNGSICDLKHNHIKLTITCACVFTHVSDLR